MTISTASTPDIHAILRSRFGLTSFKEGQEEAITAALHGERLLLIQPTGWGKSLVYQMLAHVMRDQGKGLTVVFSPLKALMRDQVARAQQIGLRAELLNSDQGVADDHDSQVAVQREILERATQGEVDMLFIAPERMENDLWNEFLPHMPIAALVVDEAHCISNWGHDFRPEYRRIVSIVRRLLSNVPVVAVTATATPAVEQEVLEQLGGGRVIRGPLARQNLRLRVQTIQGEAERFAWVADWIARLNGTGIVYGATQGQTVELAAFLRERGFAAIHYHGGIKEGRAELERQFMENEVKVVVATNALGMGVDKPDVRFVIHAQFPGSPLNYYQEIGRAGRDGQPSDVILLFDSEDAEIQRLFIRRSKPTEEAYTRVIERLAQQAYREKALAAAADLPEQVVKRVLTDLTLHGAVARDREKYYRLLKRVPLTALNVNAPYERRLQELDIMLDYAHDLGCRMRFFTRFLGDSDSSPCGTCDRCQNAPSHSLPPEVLQAARSVTEYPPLRLLNVHNKELVFASGFASDYYGGTQTGALIRHAKYEGGGDFAPALVEQVVTLIQRRLTLSAMDALTFIPPTRSGDRVEKFTGQVAQRLGLPLVTTLEKTRITQEQKEFTHREAKKQNIRGAFQVPQDIREKLKGQHLIVIDDVCDNGITLAEAGRVLRKAGAASLHAITIAKTRQSDT